MPRPILLEEAIHPAIRERIATEKQEIVQEVQSALRSHDVVVVGMKQNPNPRRARRALDEHGVPYHYLEYGSYLTQWYGRLRLKMWTGWPTFPMVFVKGTLVGGADDLIPLLRSGEFDRLLVGESS